MNPLLEDIFGQPDSLRTVIDHQSGLGHTALLRAAAEIRHARQVIFSGMGSSLFASMPAAALLNQHGRTCHSIEASELLYYREATVSRDTVAVLISRSGNTIEVVKLIPELRARGVRIIGVTNVLASTLGDQADIVIHLASASDRIVALRTYTGTVAALLWLAAEVLKVPTPDSEFLATAMQAVILALRNAPVTWVENARSIYTLGRGASLGSAHEAALLFHESARTPAVAMSVAQFRHGPVEVVTPDFRAIVFATQQETGALDSQLAADLVSLGAQARLITAPEIPLSGPFAAILEIVPVQLAAVHLTAIRGIPPAQFQYAPLVTDTESGFKPAA